MRVWRIIAWRRASTVISTHTPVRVWHNGSFGCYRYITISTHTPVRVWQEKSRNISEGNTFQLTHPWGCDVMITKSNTHFFLISTHTPVRVWLDSGTRLVPWAKISTHTPVRVWLLSRNFLRQVLLYFNSHTREGVTSIRCSEIGMTIISTHTPVRVWRKTLCSFLGKM